ncbi:proliferating cell nuclear antigen (pcna) [Candidatus Woesearchaeota archaeon]|nr:proliferating cell nuclear antigen (pcna) [Candidatus Woesearchaeota archaeon]
MKLTLSESKYLKDGISVISELVNEATFKIKPEGLEMIAMDPANVAMVVFKLLSSCFSEYSIDKPMSISINLNNFKQILRRAKPNDAVSLIVGDGKLDIILKSDSTRKFSLPLIDIEEKEKKIPDLKFPITIKTGAMVLNDAIEDVGIVAESVSFVASSGKLMVVAEGDLSKAEIEILPDDRTRIDATGSEDIRAKYSVEYLKKMIAGSKIADEVKIQFNKDYPLHIEFKSIDKAMLSFILAPRVDND